MSNKMKYYSIVISLFVFGLSFAQEQDLEELVNEARQFVATGNEVLTRDGNFPKAEGEYRKAIAKNPVDPTAKYNLANAYYNSEKYDEAHLRYKEAAKIETATKSEKHKAFHNQGNTYMEQKKYKEAVEAYKNALRNNPKDDETRYNLALAKKMLEEEQQQNDQNQDDQDQDQDQNEDQQNQDNQDQKEGDDKQDQKGDDGDNEQDQQNDKEEGEDDKDKGDQEKDDKGEPKDEEKDQGQGENEKQEQPQDQKPQQAQGQLSPQQVKSLLEAMNNEEKKVQDKINAKKAQGQKVRTDKDW